MKRAYYDSKPRVLEAVGNGSSVYHWDIREEVVESGEFFNGDDGGVHTQWSCLEVTVWNPISANKITEAVISSVWDGNYEQKMINEYNSAMLGVYDEETAAAKINVYKDFLSERTKLKSQIDKDCAELGIR